MIFLKLFFRFFYLCGSYLYNPFDNYRKITQNKNPFLTLPIWIGIVIYFTLSGFIAQKRSTTIAIAFFLTFLILFLFIGFILKKRTSFKELFQIWGFSYVSTLMWFSVTLILFFIFPPPHKANFLGATFGLIYLIFSLFCLYVKAISIFIIFKYVIKLKTSLTAILMIFIWFAVSAIGITFYKFHLFRIPFI